MGEIHDFRFEGFVEEVGDQRNLDQEKGIDIFDPHEVTDVKVEEMVKISDHDGVAGTPRRCPDSCNHGAVGNGKEEEDREVADFLGFGRSEGEEGQNDWEHHGSDRMFSSNRSDEGRDNGKAEGNSIDPGPCDVENGQCNPFVELLFYNRNG